MGLFRRLVTTIVSTALLGAVFTAPAEAAYNPLVSGHRGTVVGAPESTMAAFKYAKKVGADIIEFDVQWSKDNWMVVIHDATLDRTTNCTGLVTSKTLKQLRKCDAGNGQKIPTIGETLTYAHQAGLRTNAEIKGSSITDKKAKHYIYALKKYGMYSRNVMSNSSPAVINTFKRIDPKLTTAYINGKAPMDTKTVQTFGKSYMPTWRMVDRSEVDALKSAGVTTYIWPIRTKADFDKAYATRAGVLVTDDPKAVQKWLAAK